MEEPEEVAGVEAVEENSPSTKEAEVVEEIEREART
jgi:hypothetical protein